jgi:two-component system, OmpR family, response regulator
VMGGDYDVVTLDRILPDLDGLTIVATMRGVGMETPVLVTSAIGAFRGCVPAPTITC